MNVLLHVNAESLRRWHLRLVKALQGLDQTDVALSLSKNAACSSLDRFLSLERTLQRQNKISDADRVDRDEIGIVDLSDGSTTHVVLDLCGGYEALPAQRCLRLRFDGQCGDLGLVDALLHRGSPLIELEDVQAGKAVANGVASLEVAATLADAMEAVYSRAVLLIKRVLNGVEDETPLIEPTKRSPITSQFQAKYLAKTTARSLAMSLYKMCCHPGHWHIGYRFHDGAGVLERGDLLGAPWQILQDEVDHFYADPFPFRHQGRDWLFFEDLDHKTGKGVIAACDFDEHGQAEAVETVLELPHHLSYPFLFEWNNAIWMIPESSLNHDVVLYKSVEFPHRWEPHATLLSDVEAADVTIVEHGGRWWMFAVVRDGVGGYSDTLCLYHADSPLGPWHAHEANHLVVNHKTARPAGHIVEHEGALWRPIQDCENGYGTALALARITQLDESNFSQEIKTIIKPGSAVWPGRKLHTLNRAGRLEVIDGALYRPKWPWLADKIRQRNTPASVY